MLCMKILRAYLKRDTAPNEVPRVNIASAMDMLGSIRKAIVSLPDPYFWEPWKVAVGTVDMSV